MTLRLAIPKEILAGERRVALDPPTVAKLASRGVEVLLERDAGANAYYPDAQYQGVRVIDNPQQLWSEADVVVTVQPPAIERVRHLRPGSLLIGFMYPHRNLELVSALALGQVSTLAMELVPRISRAQSMDALSSQAAIAGYKAVLMAASFAPVFFPMLTTAAGTIRPAKVLIIGVGVAGLQAIATARRLGAIVEAFDVRSATREQVESLGAKFVDTGISAEGEGGYARELTAEEKAKQREVLARHIAAANVVITTAAIPGRAAPRIVFEDMIAAMKPGSVIIDLAAESGGNCDGTIADGTVTTGNGVIQHGPANVPSKMPLHASEMYAKNVFNLLSLLFKEDGTVQLDFDDEIVRGSCLTHAGEVTHAPTRDALAKLAETPATEEASS